MDKKTIPPDEIISKAAKALVAFSQGQPAEAEQFMLELIIKAKYDVERYFPYLYYGDILMQMSRWEEARDALTRSAQIAVRHGDNLGLALSHEKLGDLSAAEGNWFGALHQYRYAVCKAALSSDRLMMEKVQAKANTAQSMLRSAILPQNMHIIPLDKEYVSSNLVISFVHRDIFLKSYFARCLECNFCHDWCCSYGADIDILNVERIQQRKEEILPFVRPPDGEWFDTEFIYYEEYAGNEYTRINTQGPRCVFISKDKRGCGLHRYAISKQMDYHKIKPLVCILFPLSFSEGILSIAPELDDDSLICSGAGSSAYRSLRGELEYYFGSEFVEELDGMEKKIVG